MLSRMLWWSMLLSSSTLWTLLATLGGYIAPVSGFSFRPVYSSQYSFFDKETQTGHQHTFVGIQFYPGSLPTLHLQWVRRWSPELCGLRGCEENQAKDTWQMPDVPLGVEDRSWHFPKGEGAQKALLFDFAFMQKQECPCQFTPNLQGAMIFCSWADPTFHISNEDLRVRGKHTCYSNDASYSHHNKIALNKCLPLSK